MIEDFKRAVEITINEVVVSVDYVSKTEQLRAETAVIVTHVDWPECCMEAFNAAYLALTVPPSLDELEEYIDSYGGSIDEETKAGCLDLKAQELASDVFESAIDNVKNEAEFESAVDVVKKANLSDPHYCRGHQPLGTGLESD